MKRTAYERAMNSRRWIESQTGRMGHAVTDALVTELLSLSTSLARLIDAQDARITELEAKLGIPPEG